MEQLNTAKTLIDLCIFINRYWINKNYNKMKDNWILFKKFVNQEEKVASIKHPN